MCLKAPRLALAGLLVLVTNVSPTQAGPQPPLRPTPPPKKPAPTFSPSG